MMTNAKEEFLEEIEGKDLKCATVTCPHESHLKVGYSD